MAIVHDSKLRNESVHMKVACQYGLAFDEHSAHTYTAVRHGRALMIGNVSSSSGFHLRIVTSYRMQQNIQKPISTNA